MNGATAFHKVFKLVKITKAPTIINMVFKGSLPTNLAAIGAAISPPMISPNTSKRGTLFKRIKKVIELARTTKNSARQTEPITYRALLLFAINVLVTNV
ncbi:MAG: hypothetical protein JWQ09_1886, partial [Segetibacter sp.]|nr:hypothetical protein [Segetibacter sp.]